MDEPIHLWALGVDLGMRVDPSAIAILDCVGTVKERVVYDTEPDRFWGQGDYRRVPRKLRYQGLPVTMQVRFLERISLQTLYRDVVARVAGLVGRLEGLRIVAVDRNGAGESTMEMFYEAGLGDMLVPICTTGGDGSRWGDDAAYVSRNTIVDGLLAGLDNEWLLLSDALPTWEEFLAEVAGLRREHTRAGHTVTSAKEHDDLVMAVGYAAWLATDLYKQSDNQEVLTYHYRPKMIAPF